MAYLYDKETIKYAPLTSVVDALNPDAHIHTFWEIVYPLYDFVLKQYVNEYYVELTGNSFLIIKPNDLHRIVIEEDKRIVRHRNIFVDDANMKNICDSIDPSLYGQLLFRTSPIIVPFPPQTVEVLESRLNVFNNYDNNSSNQFLQSIHTTLVSYLLGLYIESQITLPTNYPAWLKTLLDNLNDPNFIKQNVSEIVKSTNYSHGHVCRQFRHYMGKTLVQFILEQRLHNSLIMLMDKSKLIVEIALDNGFYSQSSYINAFRNLFGIPPSKWRKLNAANQSLQTTLIWGNSMPIDETK